MEAVLCNYMKHPADDRTSIISEAVLKACSNQIDLARRNMLSGKQQTPLHQCPFLCSSVFVVLSCVDMLVYCGYTQMGMKR